MITIDALLLISVLLPITECVTTSQSLNCGIGGKQTMVMDATYPLSASQHSSFDIVIGGNISMPASVSGASIRSLQWYFVLPDGLIRNADPIISSITPQGTVLSGGGGLGNVDVCMIDDSVIVMRASGPIKDRSSFIPPAFRISVTAVGEVGSTQSIYSQQNPAYSLSAMMLSVRCSAVATPPLYNSITDETSGGAGKGRGKMDNSEVFRLTAWTTTVISSPDPKYSKQFSQQVDHEETEQVAVVVGNNALAQLPGTGRSVQSSPAPSSCSPLQPASCVHTG